MSYAPYTPPPFPGEGGRAEDYFARNFGLWIVVMIVATIIAIVLLPVICFVIRGWWILVFIVLLLWAGGIAVWLWCGMFRFFARE